MAQPRRQAARAPASPTSRTCWSFRGSKQDWRGACICKDAPPDLFAAVGSGYNRLFVIPSRGLVIVRQGENAKFSDAEFLRRILRP